MKEHIRHRAKIKSPGHRQTEPRATTERVSKRENVDLRERETVSDRMRIRGGKMRRTRVSVDVQPYAPLLIRLIKNRYKEDGARPRRKKLIESMENWTREPTRNPMIVYREVQGTTNLGNPLRTEPFRVQVREPAQSVDEWLSSVRRTE